MSSANDKKYKVILSRRAAAYLSRINNPYKERMVDALHLLANNPSNQTLDIKPLEGMHGELRLRVGRYRVIFVIEEPTRSIMVLTIQPRGDAYK